MSNVIKVILIDDSPLARQGWKIALQQAKDIVVSGEFSSSELATPDSPSVLADVALIGIKSITNREAKDTTKIPRDPIPRTKVIIIVNYADEIAIARRLGADEAILAPIEGHKLTSLIKGLFLENKILCEYYVEQLQTIKPGFQDAFRYEKLMSDVIQMLFYPHLTHAQIQIPTKYRTVRRDLILLNKSDHTFWKTIRDSFNASLVVFDFKNKIRISDSDLDQIGDYLGRYTGRFGMIIGRIPIGERILLKQSWIYNNNDKVVLVTCDNDIRTMLAYKAGGVDPTDFILDLYIKFISRAQ